MVCQTCHRLDALLTSYGQPLTGDDLGDGPAELRLGSVADIGARATLGCIPCRSILQSVEHHVSDGMFTASINRKQPRISIFASERESNPSTIDSLAGVDAHKRNTDFYFTTEALAPEEQRGRIVNPRHVDVPLIKSWIDRCDSAHTHVCQREADQYRLPTVDLNFIDVQDLCIVTPADQSGARYVALSYVWGTAPVFRTLKANIEDLRRPGALADGGLYRLPQTVRDAMTLTRELGVRWLWVDSVCIVQDDREAQKEQLRAMGAVYAKAYFTIVALSGTDADSGIRRVRPHSAEQRSFQSVIPLPSWTLVQACSDTMAESYGLDSHSHVWNTRGWTLQEKVFSRRVLAIDDVVTWSCFGDYWTEDVSSPSESADFALGQDHVNGRKVGVVSWPSITTYSDLATEYALRNLSWSMDTINAFTGVMTPMAQWFTGGLLSGIAEYTFDVGMLWNVGLSGARLRRDDGVDSPHVAGDFQFPSWSWISWTGKLEFGLWRVAEDYLFPRGPLTVSPLVKWQKQLLSGEWHDIDNTYHVVRKHMARQDLSQPPTGWTQHYDDQGQDYYQHESLKHITPTPRFSYPIPPFVRYRDMDFRAFHPHLRFRGKRAWVGVDVDVIRCRNALEKDLLSLEGFWCGRITLNIAEEDLVPATDELCEVIAISESVLDLNVEGLAQASFEEVHARPELGDVDLYEVINVLWIGRCHNGKVYRKALGRVWKPAWEEMAAEEVDLILS